MIEGSKSLTNGSGSGRAKNMWIRWIRIRIRIRIRNTALIRCKTGYVILPHGWLKYPGHVVFINRIHLVDELGQEALPLIVKMKVRKTNK